MSRRLLAAVLTVAVAAYATVATVTADSIGGRSGLHAGSNQPAVCPVSRPSQQLGRQTEVQPELLASLAYLFAEASDPDASPAWVRSARAETPPLFPSIFSSKTRTTRGPPRLAL